VSLWAEMFAGFYAVAAGMMAAVAYQSINEVDDELDEHLGRPIGTERAEDGLVRLAFVLGMAILWPAPVAVCLCQMVKEYRR
jgi:hypothetical protein